MTYLRPANSGPRHSSARTRLCRRPAKTVLPSDSSKQISSSPANRLLAPRLGEMAGMPSASRASFVGSGRPEHPLPEKLWHAHRKIVAGSAANRDQLERS